MLLTDLIALAQTTKSMLNAPGKSLGYDSLSWKLLKSVDQTGYSICRIFWGKPLENSKKADIKCKNYGPQYGPTKI